MLASVSNVTSHNKTMERCSSTFAHLVYNLCVFNGSSILMYDYVFVSEKILAGKLSAIKVCSD